MIYGLLILSLGCSQINGDLASVNSSDTKVVTKGGITFIEGKPYTGKLMDIYPNGDTLAITAYQSGKRHGEAPGLLL